MDSLSRLILLAARCLRCGPPARAASALPFLLQPRGSFAPVVGGTSPAGGMAPSVTLAGVPGVIAGFRLSPLRGTVRPSVTKIRNPCSSAGNPRQTPRRSLYLAPVPDFLPERIAGTPDQSGVNGSLNPVPPDWAFTAPRSARKPGL